MNVVLIEICKLFKIVLLHDHYLFIRICNQEKEVDYGRKLYRKNLLSKRFEYVRTNLHLM